MSPQESNQKHQAIPTLIASWDENFINLWTNSNYQEFIGKSEEQIKGKKMRDVIGSDLYEKNLPFLKKALNGEPQTFERDIPHQNGKGIRHCIFNYAPDIKSGVPKGIIVVVTDITEMVESQRNFESIVRNSPGMIYHFKMSAQGKLSFPFYSDKAYEIYETSKKDLDANPEMMLKMVLDEDHASMEAATSNSIKYLVPFVWTGRIKTPKNNTKHIEVKGIPQKLDDGSILWNGITIDITEKINLQNEFENEKNKVFHQSKLASVGEMAAGIAHEVNNPLTIISENLAVLHKKIEPMISNDPTLETLFGKLTTNVKRISAIIKSLKSISRKDAELSEPISVPISDLVSSVITLSTEKFKLRSIRLETDLTEGSAVCVSSQIEQVLFNLINNSVYAVESINDKWIKISAKDLGSFVQFTVTDSGNGIPIQLQEKLTQPFFTTKPVGEGTGLGLSISRKIIESHGGQFYYDSKNPNTSFVFTIPKTLGAIVESLNVETAIQAHIDWKRKAMDHFDENAIAFDLETVKNCDICYLGQWITNANRMLNQNQSFISLKKSHSEFHKHAAEFVKAKIENRDTLETATNLEIKTYEIIEKLNQLKKI